MTEQPQDADTPRPDALPVGTGRARELIGRRQQVRAPDTGRRHHLGATPARMPVLDTGGGTRTTRANAVQLASYTALELARLAEELAGEMTDAAGEKDYERAAELRDELRAVQAEIAGRSTATGSVDAS